ncbi:MAG: HAD family hydrolase, partial [Candidatus Micrarchaeaceae archaeon]
MSLIKAFFFDLDGTLVDTYEADYLAYRDAIQEVTGKSISREAFTETHGQELRSKLAALAPEIDNAAIQKISDSKKRHYPKYTHLTVLNDALIQFLATCAKEHETVLVTTAKRQNALLVLKAHNILHY